MAKATSMKTISYKDALWMVRQILDEVGTACTVRQVYYRGLKHGWWGKDGKNDKYKRYKRCSKWLTMMRADGSVGYDEVLEYGRQPNMPRRSWDSAEGYRSTIRKMFRFDAWQYQPVYVEMWTEGEAIAPIAEQALDGLRVPLIVNKGNTSTSAVHESAHRLALAVQRQIEVHHCDSFDADDVFETDPADFPDGLVHILYVGDHDAAGVHMDKDLQTRIVRHAGSPWLKEWIGLCLEQGAIEFERIAVTPDQVEEYNLPGVEQKWTDQSKNYFEEFGHMDAWAFEALPTDEAPRILREAVEGLMDKATWKRSLKLEKAVRANLSEYGSITR